MFDAQQFAARLADRQDRWSLLKDFVAEWHTPLQEGDGYSATELDEAERRLGFALPPALREWYQLAGQRDELFANDPYGFSCPQELSIEKDDHEVLWLFVETQADVSWGIRQQDLSQDDPPVYVEGIADTEGLRLSNETFSEFILQVIVHQTACFTEIGGNASGKEDTAEIVTQNFQPLGLADWGWPAYPSRLYGSVDVLVELDQASDIDCYLWIAARSEAALHEAVQLFGLGWNVLYNGIPIDEN